MQPLIMPTVQPQPACPSCGGMESYLLGDGRHKCKHCQLKYTPSPRPGRLEAPVLRALARHFWLMSPMDQVARELGLNRKTVQRYFHLIRGRIVRRGQGREGQGPPDLRGLFTGRVRAGNHGQDQSATVPIFGLAVDGLGKVRLVFVDGFGDCSGLDLASVAYVPLIPPAPDPRAAGQTALPRAFWNFARQNLKHYRGGYKKILPNYLREMEFRFNHRLDPQAADQLYALIASGPR